LGDVIDNLFISTLPVAWKAIQTQIEEHKSEARKLADRRAKKTSVRPNIFSDVIAIMADINPLIFRSYLANKDFVSESVSKYTSDLRIKSRVEKIVKYYWNTLARNVSSDALTAILATNMRSLPQAALVLDQYIGTHVFLHLNRQNELYEGPLVITKTETGSLLFLHTAQHKIQGAEKEKILNYQGIVLPYEGGAILLSVGANQATTYFRMLNLKTVHDVGSLVSYGIYSGRTTSDDVIFSARAALIPNEIWQRVKVQGAFRNEIKASLSLQVKDNAGSIVVPNELRTFYPE
jgi:hypothetical protein